MKTEIRLGSIVKNGVGGPEAGAINLIYTFLLDEFGQRYYSRIGINQIGEDLNELVLKEPGNKIHVNIRYPIKDNFETKDVKEKNQIRLNIIHTALKRVAKQFGKLELNKLDEIKEKIIKNDFSFDFVCKICISKKNKNLVAKIVVNPGLNSFNYYCLIEENQKIKCKLIIYKGLTNLYYYNDLFSDMKWVSDDKVFITGKAKQVEISVFINNCEVVNKNLTRYEKAPYFEIMRSDITQSEREAAQMNWLHSLPPGYAALIRESYN